MVINDRQSWQHWVFQIYIGSFQLTFSASMIGPLLRWFCSCLRNRRKHTTNRDTDPMPKTPPQKPTTPPIMACASLDTSKWSAMVIETLDPGSPIPKYKEGSVVATIWNKDGKMVPITDTKRRPWFVFLPIQELWFIIGNTSKKMKYIQLWRTKPYCKQSILVYFG